MTLRSEIIAVHWFCFYFMKQFNRCFALSICRKESQEDLIFFCRAEKGVSTIKTEIEYRIMGIKYFYALMLG